MLILKQHTPTGHKQNIDMSGSPRSDLQAQYTLDVLNTFRIMMREFEEWKDTEREGVR